MQFDSLSGLVVFCFYICCCPSSVVRGGTMCLPRPPSWPKVGDGFSLGKWAVGAGSTHVKKALLPPSPSPSPLPWEAGLRGPGSHSFTYPSCPQVKNDGASQGTSGVWVVPSIVTVVGISAQHPGPRLLISSLESHVIVMGGGADLPNLDWVSRPRPDNHCSEGHPTWI